MKLKKRLNIFLVVFLCVAMLSISTVSAINSKEEYNKKNETLLENEKDLENKLDKTQDELKKQEKTLKKYQGEMSELEKKIDKLNIEISKLNESIEKTEKDIKKIKKDIEEDYDILGQRLKSIYIAGETQYLEILLDCKDISTLVDAASIMQTISEHDNNLIKELNKKIDKMEAQKQELLEEKSQVSQSKDKLEVTSKDLDVLYHKTEKLISTLEVTEEKTTEELDKIHEEKDALIQELLQYQKEQAEQDSNNGNSNSNTYYPTTGSGKYIWPTPECNIITSYWGDGRGHKGWDFACNGSAYGKPIVSVADGVIKIANKTDYWGSGWGYHIMVDHGNGYATLYAHCSYIPVNVGQSVKQGQVIGYIGNTGNSFGAHLHFECWKNGVRYDPAIELG